MTPFAHVAAGYLVTQMADMLYPSLSLNTPGIIVAGIIAGNLPDLDIFFVEDKAKHRNAITHAPLFWIAVTAMLLYVSKVFSNGLFFRYSLALSLGIFSHFFTDWFAARGKDGGIRLFFPFSKKHYGLMPLKKNKLKFEGIKTLFQAEFIKYYMKDSFLFYSELILILTGMAVFLSRSFSVFLEIFQ